MGWRRVAGTLDISEGHAVQALPAQDTDFLTAWVHAYVIGEEPQVAASSYYAVYEWFPEEALPARAIKGAPGPSIVAGRDLEHPPKTLARWQRNARLRQVATAWRPGMDPAEAVGQWWAQGGTMQPLRWTPDQATAYAESLRVAGQTEEQGSGLGVLYLVNADAESRRRYRQRERGRPGSSQRERYNAKRREQRARARIRKRGAK